MFFLPNITLRYLLLIPFWNMVPVYRVVIHVKFKMKLYRLVKDVEKGDV